MNVMMIFVKMKRFARDLSTIIISCKSVTGM
jgi:hypothetical protein